MKFEKFQIKAMINNAKLLLDIVLTDKEAAELLKEVIILNSGEDVWDFLRNKYKDEYNRFRKNKS